MSRDSSSLTALTPPRPEKKPVSRWFMSMLGYSAWLAAAFVGANVLLYLTADILQSIVGPLTDYMSENLAVTLLGFMMYGYMLAILILGPRLVLKQKTTLKILGVTKWPQLSDIGLAAVGVVVYFIVAAVVLRFIGGLIDLDQAQDLGVQNLLPGIEMYVSFVLFVIVAPFVEELVFRGYLQGQLIRVGVPVWLRVLVVSALFGAAHMQWNVGINVFILSIVMCLMREWRGSIWCGVAMHMIKNGLAFYLLFWVV